MRGEFYLSSSRALSLKTLNASYCLVGSCEEYVTFFLTQLALSDQRAHLVAEANEVLEGVLGLALRQLGARAVQLADQARLIVIVGKV